MHYVCYVVIALTVWDALTFVGYKNGILIGFYYFNIIMCAVVDPDKSVIVQVTA